MAKIRKKRVRWNASITNDVAGYKLYWAVGEGVGYDSDFAEIYDGTEVILPDEISSFPLVSADVELGITAVSRAGNESDMTKCVAHFDFSAPEAPKEIIVEEMK